MGDGSSDDDKAQPAGAKDVDNDDGRPVHVVALGASAGGLDALERFFRAAPADAGLAYVVIVHLSPDFKSLMQELLGKHTTMPVRAVVDGVQLEPNHVYVIPPARNLLADAGGLRLVDQNRGSSGVNLPIDIFFESVAELYGDRVIAVVLSGTGTDGTRGMRAVKSHDGVSLVQDPASAKFDGMPRSVMDAGLADYVLRPEDIAQKIGQIASGPRPRLPISDDEHGEPTTPDLARVLNQVRGTCGLDLSYYKRTTLARRLERRMKLRSTPTVDDYIHLLEQEPAETEALKQDLLIGVTRFFRDRDAFDVLEQMVIPTLLKQQGDEHLRIWVAACSTGEEVYSLAISLALAFDRQDQPLRAKIFGTDVDAQAIEYAGRGIYPASIAADVPKDRLAKYFQATESGYRIAKSIREQVIFAPHNLVRDAPLTRMDLVSCRNFLIYLEPKLQRDVLACLHFSLKPKGVLMLGAAESVGGLAEDFETTDKRWKIFRKQRNRPMPELRRRSPLSDRSASRGDTSDPEGAAAPGTTAAAGRLEESAAIQALDSFAELRQSVCMLIGPSRKLLRVCGDPDGVLLPPRGDVRNEVLQIIVEPLKIPLTTALHRVQRGEAQVSYGDIDIGEKDEPRRVNLEVQRLPVRGGDDLAMAIVEPCRNRQPNRPDPAAFDSDAQVQIDDLEGDLQRTRENLQATIEELATTNEEQQATNEELTASNEELQSTNEELQSVNEELFTVNGEYQTKIQELNDLTNDTENLLRSTEIGVIFLDRELRIRKFTPAATRMIDLIPADIGRPLTGFSTKFVGEWFFEHIGLACREGQSFAREVQLKAEDIWFLKRVQPYRTETGAIDGVVITFVEITDLKQAQQALADQKEMLEAIASNAPVLMMASAGDGSITWCNRAFEEVLGYAAADEQCPNVLDRIFPDPKVRTLAMETDGEVDGAGGTWHDVRAVRRDGQKIDLAWANVTLSDGRRISVAQDVTQRRRDERRQAMMVRELDHRVKNNLNTVLAVAKETARLTSDVDGFTRAFEGRVRSMAIAHEMLASTRWEGADLHEMARRVLEPYGLGHGERIEIAGARVQLDRNLAPTLCMVLHELTTNAAKYGALSVPEGQVALSWVIETPADETMRLRLEWVESGGPEVVSVEHHGYGTHFVTEAVEYGLDGHADLRFDADGVKCTITLPYRARQDPMAEELEGMWEQRT